MCSSPFTVPEGTLFVMGDNRNESLDSRSSYVGCIDERDILGKVLLCFMPFTDFGVVNERNWIPGLQTSTIFSGSRAT